VFDTIVRSAAGPCAFVRLRTRAFLNLTKEILLKQRQRIEASQPSTTLRINVIDWGTHSKKPGFL